MIFLQCIVDVFFIDWERPRGVVGNSADTAKTKEVGTGCRGDGRVIKLQTYTFRKCLPLYDDILYKQHPDNGMVKSKETIDYTTKSTN